MLCSETERQEIESHCSARICSPSTHASPLEDIHYDRTGRRYVEVRTMFVPPRLVRQTRHSISSSFPNLYETSSASSRRIIPVLRSTRAGQTHRDHRAGGLVDAAVAMYVGVWLCRMRCWHTDHAITPNRGDCPLVDLPRLFPGTFC